MRPIHTDGFEIWDSEMAKDTEGLPEPEMHLDEEEGRDPRYILGRKLLSLGKIHFRHIENLPEWLRLRIKVRMSVLLLDFDCTSCKAGERISIKSK